MGTLRDELTKINALDSLKFDDEDGAVLVVQDAGSDKSSRQVYWEFLRDNRQAMTVNAMAEQFGVPVKDMAAIFYKFYQRDLVTRVDVDGRYAYRAKGDTYPTMTTKERIERMRQARLAIGRKSRATKRRGVSAAATSMQASPAQTRKPVDLSCDIDNIICGLSVLKARELYDKLHKIFGG